MLPEVFVCCCLMAISLLTFVIAANTPGNTNLRLNSQSAARDAAVMTNHSTAWWHCPSVHHTYILSRFALVLIFSHTSSSSWAFTTRSMQQIEFPKKLSFSSSGLKIIRRRVVKFSVQIKISNNALQIQRVSAIIPVKPFCHKTLKSLPGSQTGAGKMTTTAIFGDPIRWGNWD